MSVFIDQLEKSRLAGLIEKVEAGQPVDLAQYMLLQHLEIVRSGQTALAESLKRSEARDDQLEQLLGGNGVT